MNNEDKKKRIEYIDIAKGIAIICVIMGHLGKHYINSVVFTFHIPIFFIISGYFIKSKKNTKELIKSMCKSLLLPYLLTCLIILIVETISTDYGFKILKLTSVILSSLYGSGTRISYFLHIKPIGAIWFLLALFWAKLLYNLIIDKKYRVIYCIVFFIIGYVSAKFIWLPFSIQAGLVSVIFLYIGNKMKEYNFFSHLNIKTILLFIIIWICEIKLNARFFGDQILSITRCSFPCIPLNIIGAISGSLTVIGISKYLNKIKGISRFFEFIGKNSLIFLCAHLVELRTIPFYQLVSLFFKSEFLVVFIVLVIKLLWGSIFVLLYKYIKRCVRLGNKYN